MTAKRSAKKQTTKKAAKSPSRTAKKKPTSKTASKAKASKPRAEKKTSAPKKQTAKKAVAKKTPATKKPRAAAKPKAAPRKKAPSKAKRRPTVDLQSFRERLRTKQQELLQAYISAKGDSRTRESDGTEDYIDYAVSSYYREFLLSLTELEQSQLRLVEEALKRIDSGEFGLCIQCERPIVAKRLEVQPWARYCLRCQELADMGMGDEHFEFPSTDDDVEDEVEVDEIDTDGDDEEEGDAEADEEEELIGG